MKRIKSLNIMMVIFIFFIMVSSGLLTSVCFLFFYALDFFPFPFLTPILSPFIALLVSSIIGTSLSAMVSEKFLKPLHQLIDATKIIAKGDFSVRVPEINSDSEIAVLLRNFNQMAEELGSIEMFRNDFINNFSHEFKTPIVSIRGFAKQLQNENLSEEKRKEYTEIIISEAERLTKMSSNVLLLTKIENQQFITNQAEYDLDEQIRNCIILLEKQWSKKNLEMNLNLSNVKIFSDEELLSHLWINLIDNAVKYTDDNGRISITLYETGDNIVFRISDNGKGMDEYTIKHIFDKFYQADKSRSTHGNGLGLSIVKRIVELCRGEITVDSKLGAGTTFTVILPKCQKGGIHKN
ncbi:alkaline phosphatase synthesis sensor protein PhoR [Thermoclostridium stercorarium subsp. stercorarium DSM 8532]|jgi:signal transduction histidine kinase|uniref:Heme sensor protein HssS n=2 Tax=Thermoclostridium stercorarium TaxID=1510 RepID=L7VQK3_THES1|nr:HAMP domain-containing sensor histidine kinase [Thermoclostridium stercorarium]AGC68666.1 alkaline phosphatase synthesis sensor protein PhoR [Thermoclostridium stercorarium subsp. stercorarium DSM 8532]AGI39677.1 histidine kinase [Thermoclostridium stercorarium subsp. stercorarium DSM 8532]ANW99003.1 two-component sensor histidine kinase [Thermoclostridium stercorarium subsp. thermolacticum DSM 2910]